LKKRDPGLNCRIFQQHFSVLLFVERFYVAKFDSTIAMLDGDKKEIETGVANLKKIVQ
jgi:hypothetical protein